MAPGRREALVLGAIGLGAAALGALTGALALQARSGAAGLLGAPFLDLSGRPRRLLEWQGAILVVNFWATWCVPCREEIPMLVVAAQHYRGKGAEIVGIGIDNASNVAQFARTYAIAYPLLIADAKAIDLMRGLGNGAGGLPFTVVLDRRGVVAYRKLGALSRPDLDRVLVGMLL
jgi:thiol-disulfide isomerase/thioredoxin